MLEKGIFYLEMIVGGDARGIVGYCRVEKDDKRFGVRIKVKDIPSKFTGIENIYIQLDDQCTLIGNINILDGEGEETIEIMSSISKNIVSINQIESFIISLDQDRQLVAENRNRSRNMGSTNEEEKLKKNSEENVNAKEILDKNVSIKNRGENIEDNIKENTNENIEEGRVEKTNNGEKIIKQESEQEDNRENKTENKQANIQINKQEKRLEDETGPLNKGPIVTKWDHLSAIYPHINPFHDEREYLTISPSDFVILNEKSYGLSKNSFLLHGFYNYGHIILKRAEGAENNKYYIGVPGAYFDREKQVAVMYGFESFEGKNERAGAGEYGYYLVKTEL